MILEGSLLHYGAPRVVRVEDPDLAMLMGEQLYALGLSRLAELGDLEAVGELADLISLLARLALPTTRRWPTRSGRRARPRSAGGGRPSTRRLRRWPGPEIAPRWRRCFNALGATPPIPSEDGACDARLFVDCTL